MNTSEIMDDMNRLPGTTSSLGPDSVLDVLAPAKEVPGILAALKKSGFGHLSFLTAKDLPSENLIELVYRLFSYVSRTDASVRTRLDRGNPSAPTVSGIFRTAEWHERETAEMFGVEFSGHPCPGKLLLPDGVEAPLRKDFKHEEMTPLPAV